MDYSSKPIRITAILQNGLKNTAVHLRCIDFDDLLALFILTPIFWSFISYFCLPKPKEPGFNLLYISPQRLDGLLSEDGKRQEESRDINRKMLTASKDVVIFWGSQSGKAARLAKQLAREMQIMEGIATTAEDLDSYDHHHLAQITSDKIIGFVVSTYGEGDPPDNAMVLSEQLQSFSRSAQSLSKLKYFVFGLGSSKYQHFNKFADFIHGCLEGAGATRLCYVGKLDAATTSQTAWSDWKDCLLRELRSSTIARAPISAPSLYSPEIELIDLTHVSSKIPLSRLAADIYASKTQGRINTCIAPISAAKRLSLSETRSYMHIDLNIGESENCIRYETGDHVAVWPMSTDQEVHRFAKLFGWDEQTLNEPIQIKTCSETVDLGDLPLGQTSRDSLLRYHLDIHGAPPREMLPLLSHFAPTSAARAVIDAFYETDEGLWNEQVISNCYTCGQLMQMATPSLGATWPSALFSLLVQTLPMIQPRYFSISSSSLVSPTTISLTVKVLSKDLGSGKSFHGLATSYLSALQKQFAEHLSSNITTAPSYALSGPRNKLDGQKLHIHIRPSHFKLTPNCQKPIIMVAAGSGIAPFLAFAQEREALAKEGKTVGPTVLFFGCRNPSEDFLYADEWARISRENPFFSMETAFSRAVSVREYVQDRVAASQENVLRMLVHQGAILYICGSVDMANEVKRVLQKCFIDSGLGKEDFLERLKTERRLQEDTWAS